MSAGKLSKKNGFSFIEIMITIVILAVGITTVYRGFLISVDYMNHLNYRLYASVLLDDKLNELQQQFQTSGYVPLGINREPKEVTINNKEVKYLYNVEIRNVGNLDDILQIDLKLSWIEGNRNALLSRSAYISKH